MSATEKGRSKDQRTSRQYRKARPSFGQQVRRWPDNTRRFFTNVRKRDGGTWPRVAAGVIAGLILLSIVFAVPFKTVTRQVTETYYTTETRQEPYTVTEPYPTSQAVEQTKVFADGFYKVIPSGIVIPFSIDKPEARLVGRFENPIQGIFVIFDAANHIIWERLGDRADIDVPLAPGKYRARFQESKMWAEDCYIYLAMKWAEPQKTTTYREVTEYRQVLVPVESQTKIVKQGRISLWQQIFGSS